MTSILHSDLSITLAFMIFCFTSYYFFIEIYFDVVVLQLFINIAIIFIDSYLDLPDSEDAAALRNVSEDFAAGIVAAATPVVLRDDI